MSSEIILVGRYCEDSLKDAAEPFLRAGLSTIFVSVPFEGYGIKDNAATERAALNLQRRYPSLRCLFGNDPMTEAAARNLGWKKLLEKTELGDHIWLVDADEFYTGSQVLDVERAIKNDPFVAVWNLHFKNYVGDTSHYVEGTCSPRIWKRRLNAATRFHEFYHDCDAHYIQMGQVIKDTGLARNTIPKKTCYVKHYSWCPQERAKEKIRYQIEERGWDCSYKWDEIENKVLINQDYWDKIGQVAPTILQD